MEHLFTVYPGALASITHISGDRLGSVPPVPGPHFLHHNNLETDRIGVDRCRAGPYYFYFSTVYV